MEEIYAVHTLPEVSDPKLKNYKQQRTEVQKFYSGKKIFITGGTGFMGKILLEKLLRSCPDISTIYLLIREKKGKSIHARLEEMLDDVVFSRLKQEMPKFSHKLVPVSGDCTFPSLGLSIENINTLKEEVNIVFHVAATVRFDEKLKLAIAINVNGTEDIVKLSKDMKNLQSIVHVSTAYSNCHLTHIDEVLYQYPINYEEIRHVLNKMDDNSVEKITPKILGKWPNTYAFTKAMAEDLIRQTAGNLPIAIFRPAIVVSTYKEPIKGWIDNFYGPTGVVAGGLSGILRTQHCDENITANIIPVDMCINALIASAWDVAANRKNETKIKVYNYISSVEKPLTWGEYHKINLIFAAKTPYVNSIWPLSFETYTSSFTNDLNLVLFHMIPAIIYDLIAILFGQKPRLFKIYKKIKKFSKVISYFCTNEWTFSNDNVEKLWSKLSQEDQDIFNFDMKKMDWLEYFRNSMLGIRLYMFKDDPSTIPLALKRQRRLYIAFEFLKSIFYYITVYTFLCAIYKLYQNVSFNNKLNYNL